MRRNYFQHCEISPTCITNRGLLGAYREACQRLEDEYLKLASKLNGEPNGRVLVTVGWQTPPDETETSAS